MKDIKAKVAAISSTEVINTNGSTGSLKQNTLATEEQIRVAKLSQINSKEEQNIKDNIKSISEITGEPPDIASLALHDCHYDTSTAIQNILDGMYKQEQDGWETTKTRKGKKNVSSTVQTPSSNVNHSEVTQKTMNKPKNMDSSGVGFFEEQSEQKMLTKQTRYIRGVSGSRGRSQSRNWRNDDHPSNDEKIEQSHDQENSRERIRSSIDRGRGRGRGRGGFRGNMSSRGSRGGARGGFSRGGAFRGNSRQQRGGFGNRAGKSHEDKVIENGASNEETWDIEPEEDASPKVEDWSEDVVEDNSDWSKAEWAKDTEGIENAGSLFSNDAKWSQMNGAGTPKEKYIPEHIDTAVIRSIPTSSTSGEVTSYQPTNDLSRYMTTASNQFPSSHQDGGLTNSLNDRTFSLPSESNPSDSIQHGLSSMPMVSGVTESHKLEQEQMHASKSQRTQLKPRKAHHKYVQLPSQPVVMPRSAQMVNDAEEQFTGLEFGSAPISPRFKKTVHEVEEENIVIPSPSPLANQHLAEETARRQQVTSLQSEPMLQSSTHGVPSPSVLSSSPGKGLEHTKNDIPKTPPGFKPLGQNNSSQYLGSPGRGLSHMGADTISYPSATNRTSPTPPNSLNVFSRNGGLGTSVGGNDQQSLSYSDQQIYEKRDQNITAEKVIAEQRALAEKQMIAEHQRMLSQRERDRVLADQKAFAEQKSLAQQKRWVHEDSSLSDRLSSDLSDHSKMPDNRLGLNDSLQDRQTSMDKGQLSSNDNGYLSSKIHSSTSASSLSSSTHVAIQPSPYSNTTNNEMIGLTSATEVQTTTKPHAASNKVSTAPPPGVVPQMNLYAGVQPGHGMIPAYQHQHMPPGYNYEEMLQMQRLPVSPYGYDVSMFQAAGNPTATARDGLQTYQQGNDSKFPRGTEESAVSIQGNPPHAAGNMNPHQQAAYLNAASQLPYGYYYQPNVLPQYPASAIYQVQQGKGVPGTTYQSQYQGGQQQQGYNSNKFPGGGSHDYSKAYHNSVQQQTLSQHVKPAQHIATSSAIQSSSHQAMPSVFKTSQYNQDGKGFLGNSPTSLNAQPGLQLHNQAAHQVGTMNHYLMQQQVGATHLGHHVDPAASHRNQVHGQIPFSANQQKRDHKGNYQSYWSAPR